MVRQALIEAYPDDAVHPVAAPVREVTVIRISAAAQAAKGGKFQRVAVVLSPPCRPMKTSLTKSSRGKMPPTDNSLAAHLSRR